MKKTNKKVKPVAKALEPTAKNVWAIQWATGGFGTLVFLNGVCLPSVRTAEVMHDCVDGHIRLKLDITIAPGDSILEMATDARLYTSDPNALKGIARMDDYMASISAAKKGQEAENSAIKKRRDMEEVRSIIKNIRKRKKKA